MKKYLLILIGIIPLISGILINYLIISLEMYGTGIIVSGAIFLIIWFIIGFTVAKSEYDTKSILFYSLLLCLVNYILLMYQLLVLHRMWFNFMGRFTQFYVLPAMSFTFGFSYPVGYYTAATVIIAVTYVLGVSLSKRIQI